MDGQLTALSDVVAVSRLPEGPRKILSALLKNFRSLDASGQSKSRITSRAEALQCFRCSLKINNECAAGVGVALAQPEGDTEARRNTSPETTESNLRHDFIKIGKTHAIKKKARQPRPAGGFSI